MILIGWRDVFSGEFDDVAPPSAPGQHWVPVYIQDRPAYLGVFNTGDPQGSPPESVSTKASQ